MPSGGATGEKDDPVARFAVYSTSKSSSKEDASQAMSLLTESLAGDVTPARCLDFITGSAGVVAYLATAASDVAHRYHLARRLLASVLNRTSSVIALLTTVSSSPSSPATHNFAVALTSSLITLTLSSVATVAWSVEAARPSRVTRLASLLPNRFASFAPPPNSLPPPFPSPPSIYSTAFVTALLSLTFPPPTIAAVASQVVATASHYLCILSAFSGVKSTHTASSTDSHNLSAAVLEVVQAVVALACGLVGVPLPLSSRGAERGEGKNLRESPSGTPVHPTPSVPVGSLSVSPSHDPLDLFVIMQHAFVVVAAAEYFTLPSASVSSTSLAGGGEGRDGVMGDGNATQRLQELKSSLDGCVSHVVSGMLGSSPSSEGGTAPRSSASPLTVARERSGVGVPAVWESVLGACALSGPAGAAVCVRKLRGLFAEKSPSGCGYPAGVGGVGGERGSGGAEGGSGACAAAFEWARALLLPFSTSPPPIYTSSDPARLPPLPPAPSSSSAPSAHLHPSASSFASFPVFVPTHPSAIRPCGALRSPLAAAPLDSIPSMRPDGADVQLVVRALLALSSTHCSADRWPGTGGRGVRRRGDEGESRSSGEENTARSRQSPQADGAAGAVVCGQGVRVCAVDVLGICAVAGVALLCDSAANTLEGLQTTASGGAKVGAHHGSLFAIAQRAAEGGLRRFCYGPPASDPSNAPKRASSPRRASRSRTSSVNLDSLSSAARECRSIIYTTSGTVRASVSFLPSIVSEGRVEHRCEGSAGELRTSTPTHGSSSAVAVEQTAQPAGCAIASAQSSGDSVAFTQSCVAAQLRLQSCKSFFYPPLALAPHHSAAHSRSPSVLSRPAAQTVTHMYDTVSQAASVAVQMSPLPGSSARQRGARAAVAIALTTAELWRESASHLPSTSEGTPSLLSSPSASTSTARGGHRLHHVHARSLVSLTFAEEVARSYNDAVSTVIVRLQKQMRAAVSARTRTPSQPSKEDAVASKKLSADPSISTVRLSVRTEDAATVVGCAFRCAAVAVAASQSHASFHSWVAAAGADSDPRDHHLSQEAAATQRILASLAPATMVAAALSSVGASASSLVVVVEKWLLDLFLLRGLHSLTGEVDADVGDPLNPPADTSSTHGTSPRPSSGGVAARGVSVGTLREVQRCGPLCLTDVMSTTALMAGEGFVAQLVAATVGPGFLSSQPPVGTHDGVDGNVDSLGEADMALSASGNQETVLEAGRTHYQPSQPSLLVKALWAATTYSIHSSSDLQGPTRAVVGALGVSTAAAFCGVCGAWFPDTMLGVGHSHGHALDASTQASQHEGATMVPQASTSPSIPPSPSRTSTPPSLTETASHTLSTPRRHTSPPSTLMSNALAHAWTFALEEGVEVERGVLRCAAAMRLCVKHLLSSTANRGKTAEVVTSMFWESLGDTLPPFRRSDAQFGADPDGGRRSFSLSRIAAQASLFDLMSRLARTSVVDVGFAIAIRFLTHSSATAITSGPAPCGIPPSSVEAQPPTTAAVKRSDSVPSGGTQVAAAHSSVPSGGGWWGALNPLPLFSGRKSLQTSVGLHTLRLSDVLFAQPPLTSRGAPGRLCALASLIPAITTSSCAADDWGAEDRHGPSPQDAREGDHASAGVQRSRHTSAGCGSSDDVRASVEWICAYLLSVTALSVRCAFGALVSTSVSMKPDGHDVDAYPGREGEGDTIPSSSAPPSATTFLPLRVCAHALATALATSNTAASVGSTTTMPPPTKIDGVMETKLSPARVVGSDGATRPTEEFATVRTDELAAAVFAYTPRRPPSYRTHPTIVACVCVCLAMIVGTASRVESLCRRHSRACDTPSMHWLAIAHAAREVKECTLASVVRKVKQASSQDSVAMYMEFAAQLRSRAKEVECGKL